MAKAGKKGGKAISVDFTGVKEGGTTRVAPGDYAVKVTKVEQKLSSKDKPMLLWHLEGVNGALKGKKLYYNTSLQEQALFNLRNVLMACKVDVPKGKMSIDLKKLIGLVFGVTVDDDEYKGRTKSAIIDVFPVSVKKGKMVKEELPDDDDEFEEDDEDLEEDLDEEEDEEEDEEDEEDEEESPYDDMDRNALKKEAKDRGIKVTKKMSDDDIRGLLKEDDEDED